MGAPPIPAALAAHARAMAGGRAFYVDPVSGLYVMTAAQLQKRGYCCGKGCRHCPYPPEAQRLAGRPGA